MVRYILQQIKITSHKCFGKWFAKNVVEETIDLDALADHMSHHNSLKKRHGFSYNAKTVFLYDLLPTCFISYVGVLESDEAPRDTSPFLSHNRL